MRVLKRKGYQIRRRARPVGTWLLYGVSTRKRNHLHGV